MLVRSFPEWQLDNKGIDWETQGRDPSVARQSCDLPQH